MHPVPLHHFTVRAITGDAIPLATWRGQVLLIVNVASRCGFTPQYRGLEALYRRYRDRGFAVLGFPCNQFGGQEPGDEPAIGAFCRDQFDVTFPLFSKVEVNGRNADPVYRYLKHARPGRLGIERIGWNFTKFLVDREGDVRARFGPRATPEAIVPTVEALL